jgi:hypothetical protein
MAYLIICISFYNVHMNRCLSISRLQLLGALGQLDALEIYDDEKLVYNSFKTANNLVVTSSCLHFPLKNHVQVMQLTMAYEVENNKYQDDI